MQYRTFNEETGEQYYLNRITGDKTVERYVILWNSAHMIVVATFPGNAQSVYEYRPEGYTTPRGDSAAVSGPWQKFWDEENESEFYYNNVTEESVFERPAEYVSPRATAEPEKVQKYWDEDTQQEMFYDPATGTSSFERPETYETPRIEDSQLVESGQNNWEKYWDENQQQEFYYNTTTNESTFERPITYQTPRLETGASNWAKYWDEGAQQEFYYNDHTKESKFERPADFVTPRPETYY